MWFGEHLVSRREARIQYWVVKDLVRVHIVHHRASELNGFQGQEGIQYVGRSCDRKFKLMNVYGVLDDLAE